MFTKEARIKIVTMEIMHISTKVIRAFPAVLSVDNMHRASKTLSTFPHEISSGFHTDQLSLESPDYGANYGATGLQNFGMSLRQKCSLAE